jgi:hypothetical protein
MPTSQIWNINPVNPDHTRISTGPAILRLFLVPVSTTGYTKSQLFSQFKKIFAQNKPHSRFQAHLFKNTRNVKRWARITRIEKPGLGRIHSQNRKNRLNQARTENGSQKGGYPNSIFNA